MSDGILVGSTKYYGKNLTFNISNMNQPKFDLIFIRYFVSLKGCDLREEITYYSTLAYC